MNSGHEVPEADLLDGSLGVFVGRTWRHLRIVNNGKCPQKFNGHTISPGQTRYFKFQDGAGWVPDEDNDLA